MSGILLNGLPVLPMDVTLDAKSGLDVVASLLPWPIEVLRLMLGYARRAFVVVYTGLDRPWKLRAHTGHRVCFNLRCGEPMFKGRVPLASVTIPTLVYEESQRDSQLQWASALTDLMVTSVSYMYGDELQLSTWSQQEIEWGGFGLFGSALGCWEFDAARGVAYALTDDEDDDYEGEEYCNDDTSDEQKGNDEKKDEDAKKETNEAKNNGEDGVRIPRVGLHVKQWRLALTLKPQSDVVPLWVWGNRPREPLLQKVQVVRVSPCGSRLYVAETAQRVIYILDTRSGKLVAAWTIPHLCSIDVEPLRGRLCVGRCIPGPSGFELDVLLLDENDGSELCRYPLPCEAPQSHNEGLCVAWGDKGEIYACHSRHSSLWALR